MPIWKVYFIMNKDYLVDRLKTQRKSFRYPEKRIKNWKPVLLIRFCSRGSESRWINWLSFQSLDFRKQDSKPTSSLQGHCTFNDKQFSPFDYIFSLAWVKRYILESDIEHIKCFILICCGELQTHGEILCYATDCSVASFALCLDLITISRLEGSQQDR